MRDKLPPILPTNRSDARLLGMKWFMPVKPCKNGHMTKRRITGQCCQCQAEWQASDEGRAYLKHYRASPTGSASIKRTRAKAKRSKSPRS